MKKIQHELRYDGATVDQVFTMLSDPAFREQVCADQGSLRTSVSVNRTGDTMTASIDMTQAAEGIPSFATKFVGSEIQIVQTENWSSPTQATLQMAIPGKPGDINGTIRLAEIEGGVTETVLLEIRVSIPFLGGKIEDLVSGLLVSALNYENTTGTTWLASHA